jgi:predicted small lipoprotein YifL
MKPSKCLLFFLALLTLTACGQPGPLYLPDQKPPIQTAPEPEPEKNK